MLIGCSSSLSAIQLIPSSLIKPKRSCQRCSNGKAALRFRSGGYWAIAASTCRFNSAGIFVAVESITIGRLLGKRARFRRYLVVLEQHRHRAIGLPIKIGCAFKQHKILGFDSGRRTKNGFHLFLAHSFGHLVDIGLGKTLPAAREEKRANEKQDNPEASALHCVPRLVSLPSTSS